MTLDLTLFPHCRMKPQSDTFRPGKRHIVAVPIAASLAAILLTEDLMLRFSKLGVTSALAVAAMAFTPIAAHAEALTLNPTIMSVFRSG